jgi:DNA-binding transcriptional LysR family regulator
MGVDLERMAIFAAVAETGSFTAAAERLGLAKSAVSLQLTQLERELGVQLLQRTTRKVSITEAGAAFLEDCRDLLQRAELAVERARSTRARPSGVLRITSTEDSAALVAHWLAEYRRRYPEVRIDYQPTDRRVDLIGEGFDLALRVGGMADSSLRATTLASFEIWLVASAAYLEQRGEPHHPAELADHEWIALSVISPPWMRHFTGPDGRQESVRLHGAVSVSTAAALLHLVRADLGIGSFPDSMVRADIAAGRLRRLLTDYSLPGVHLYAAYPGSTAVPAKTRAFIDLARELGAD